MTNLKTKLLVGAGTALPVLAMATPAFAAEGDNPVVTAIQSTVTTMTADAAPVIAAAVGLGALWWGARFLWGKFKSMAK